MIKDLLNRKPKKKLRPKKELKLKSVPAERFNSMIDYYTRELQSRLAEIAKLKQENELLIKTSIRNSSRAGESEEALRKLNEDVRVLQTRLRDSKKQS